MGSFVPSLRCCGTMRLIQCSCLLLVLHFTQGQRGGIFSFFGNLFRPRRPNQGGVPVISPQGFRVRPLITLDERPRNVAAASENRPQFAQQLAADGGVVTLSTTTSPPTTSRGGLFRPGDECRQDFHCKGNENCVRRNERESVREPSVTLTETAMTS